MRWLFVGAAAISTLVSMAHAQSKSDFFLDRSKIDISACVPQNPNCECKPAKHTCWFKTPDQQIIFFEKDSMKVISKAQYETE
ncbi:MULTISPECIES: hypothetical protein [Agrobacterium]|uniref:hypothetical protein n=1 Tax=Agrobacterium TaxID=357 RepID=UPI0009BB66E0|nr:MULTISPECIES: hypothetical protein [Agrobacterium]QCL77116.1 hypothetical protein CFBP5499_27125 [Agrobacterium tumefaciens]CUX70181.1 exported hypothetical protein [Agrobacterium sp. NCPPB 925]